MKTEFEMANKSRRWQLRYYLFCTSIDIFIYSSKQNTINVYKAISTTLLEIWTTLCFDFIGNKKKFSTSSAHQRSLQTVWSIRHVKLGRTNWPSLMPIWKRGQYTSPNYSGSRCWKQMWSVKHVWSTDKMTRQMIKRNEYRMAFHQHKSLIKSGISSTPQSSSITLWAYQGPETCIVSLKKLYIPKSKYCWEHLRKKMPIKVFIPLEASGCNCCCK